MNIYKAEADIDGLADKILASTSIAYTTELMPWSPTEREQLHKQKLALAASVEGKKRSISGITDKDLFFTKSILVSTNWNKNDDVFSPGPVWAARHTASHKPTNLEHDETKLVGHITDTWALDNDGNDIPDSIAVDELPSLFHIANGAVIYTAWQDSDLVERTQQLIEQIQAGTKFVSMEALFGDFSYAIRTPEGENHVLERDSETAFLTKHLRIYGGSGEFDGCKVGRLLRDITFSGKGYVDKPANPYSTIFKDQPTFNIAEASTKNPFKSESGVLISYNNEQSTQKGDKIMAENLDLLKSQNSKLEETVEKLQAKVEQLTEAASKAGIKALEDKVSALEKSLEDTKANLEESEARNKEAEEEKKAAKSELEEVTKAKEKLEAEVTEAKAARVKADRISSLVDGGVDRETAESKVEIYASLDDTQFESVATDIIAVARFGKKDDDKKDDKDDKKKDDSKASDKDDETVDPAETSADDKTLDDAKADDDVALAADADKEKGDLEETRAELRKALASSLGHDVEEDDDKKDTE